MSRLVRAATAVGVLVAAAPLASQDRFVFTLDSSLSAFTFSGTTSLGAIVGSPNNFNASGAVDLDLVAASGVASSGQFVHGSSFASVPTLNANVGLFVSVSVTGVTLQFSSASFAIGGGSFSTQVVATMVTGSAQINTILGSTTVPLAGTQSNPASINGTLTHGSNGFTLDVPLSGTFPFSEPTTGLSGSITITGTVNGEDDALSADTHSISLGTGGSQNLTLSAGSANAGGVYLVLSSASGTAPGLTVNGVPLPLNPDSWLVTSATGANSPPFINTVGTLDAGGQSTAAITFPQLNIPVLFGLTFDHAYLVLSGFTATFGSNAVSLQLDP